MNKNKYHTPYYLPKEQMELLKKLDQRIGLNLRTEKIFIYNRKMEKRPFKRFVVTYRGFDWDVVYIPTSPRTFTNKLAFVREGENGGEVVYVNKSFVFVESFLTLLRSKGLKYSV